MTTRVMPDEVIDLARDALKEVRMKALKGAGEITIPGELFGPGEYQILADGELVAEGRSESCALRSALRLDSSKLNAALAKSPRSVTVRVGKAAD